MSTNNFYSNQKNLDAPFWAFNTEEWESSVSYCPCCSHKISFSGICGDWENFRQWKDFRGEQRKLSCWGIWGKGYYFLHFIVPVDTGIKKIATHRLLRVKQLPAKLINDIDPELGFYKLEVKKASKKRKKKKQGNLHVKRKQTNR